MIFDGRSVHDIKDEEIQALVTNHIQERRHLEYKITINHKDDKDKLEVLKDIASLANSGGGYLIVGIRDDGHGKAQIFEPSNVGDTEAIKKSITSLCIDYITERIDGLEIVARKIESNPVVIVRVPTSERIPHMVNYNNRTDFYIRHNDGKREMTIREIREQFSKDEVRLRLSIIERHIRLLTEKESNLKRTSLILEKIKKKEHIDLLSMVDGELLYYASYENFKIEIESKPYMYVSITPTKPQSELINVDHEKLKRIYNIVPDLRPHGWTVYHADLNYQREKYGISFGDKEFCYLKLLENGHSEYWVFLDENFCWTQTKEEFLKQPKMYPIPVLEYPLSFLKYYRNLIDLFKINGEFIINLNYKNIEGYILNPYTRNMWGYQLNSIANRLKKYSEEELLINTKIKHNDFNPDKIVFYLLKRVYAAFGFEPSKIHFFNGDTETFNIPD